MPKRNNPFGDHSTLQLKTHIGTKEVNKGVAEKTRMQSVYDKTHDLLYSGMKSFVSGSEVNNNNNNTFGFDREMIGQTDVKKDHLKQTHIGSQCQLVTDDVEMDDCDNNAFSAELPTSWNFSCPSTSDCQSDFVYGRTPSEHSPTGFVSAASLVMPSDQSQASTSGKSVNIFERMKQAQLKAASTKSLFRGGACHSCRQPVHSKDVMKCQFCENYVCCACTRQCGGCFLHFCQLCSILNYNQAKERAFCLTCNNG